MTQALFLAAGIAVGIIQFILLKKFIGDMLSGGKVSVIFLILKVLVYAGMGALIYFFMPYVIYIAAGYGVGITAGAVFNFIKRR